MRTRCKVWVESVKDFGQSFEVQMRAVGGNKVQKGYPPDGTDEDNTYALLSPSADFKLSVTNPALFGEFKAGEKRYVDISEPVD